MPLFSEFVEHKPARAGLLLAAVAAYGVACALLAPPAAAGELSELYVLLTAWVLGLGVMLVLDEPAGRFSAGGMTLLKALWLNLGVVVSSLFVAPEYRLLLLTVPLFGVLYAALHLSRRQVATVTSVTWLAYVLGTLMLLGGTDQPFTAEGRLALAFTLMLIAMYFMANEVTALRRAFDRRRQRLDVAMQKLADMAMRDELTGLFNRRYITEVLARQKALADRGHVGFTLCYCDLDFFKRVNDRFGHQCGDEVLRAFADLADQVVRSVDFVARFGGEEFLLVLVDADAGEAGRVARRLGERTRTLEIDPDHPDYRLSVSVGIAEFQPGESIEDLLQRADRALYRAKSAGRDLVVVG